MPHEGSPEGLWPCGIVLFMVERAILVIKDERAKAWDAACLGRRSARFSNKFFIFMFSQRVSAEKCKREIKPWENSQLDV
jgi:hypothetical protein